jgi:23S rRNA (cytidine1920-2'-O)/16S rRNA (cytidine1409-2'-O)-methyltransferase
VVKKARRLSLLERLVGEGLSADRDSAAKEILAGLVRVNGSVVDKVGAKISADDSVQVISRKEFVSRAAYKLDSALSLFPINVGGAICADVGACSGGFTQVLLQRGAQKIFAIDVGYGDLDWKVRSDPRVVVMERTNARYIKALPEPVSLVVIDVSFISLDKILPVIVTWFGEDVKERGGDIVALIKPQFEAERGDIGAGGIVRDPEVHSKVCARIEAMLPGLGLIKCGLETSPILGAEGNKEFLLWARVNSI